MPEAVAERIRISVVIPSYRREEILVGTLETVLPQREPGDEVIVVDQTMRHEPGTEARLFDLERRGAVQWVRKSKPSICEAMNLGAALSRGDLLVFLDDDSRPLDGFFEAYRRVFGGADAPLAACGQILQPWDDGPSDEPGGDAESFNFASRHAGELVSVMAGNFAIRRDVFFEVGGMDEAFRGGAYRCDAEVGYRLLARTKRRVRFVPEASVRHLHEEGGTRAHGHKDTWAAIESAIGDYYLGFRCFPPGKAALHAMRRVGRAPFNRNTLKHPWLIVSVLLREVVAFCRAAGRATARTRSFVRPASDYIDVVARAGGESL